MPSFPKPKFPYTFSVSKEIAALKSYSQKAELKIPKSKRQNLLIATWNLANLGEQDRQLEHLNIIGEIISWFDLIAIQETKENLEDVLKIAAFAGKQFKVIFSDEGGNNERMLFIYRSDKVSVLEEVAELAIPPKEYKDIKLPGVTTKFTGFDRSPFMVSFAAGSFKFSLLNCHLYFGQEDEDASIDRRCLEAYCIARWADLRI